MKIYQWLTFILLAVVVCLIFFWPSTPPNSRELELRDSITLHKQKAAAAIKVSQAIVLKMEQDSVKNIVSENAFKIENKRLRKELSKKRVVVQPIIDTIPSLSLFVEQQDSLIQLQATRIDSLVIEKYVMGKSYTFLVAAKDQELAAMRAINDNLGEVLKINKKDLRRARRGNRLLKVGIIALPVGALIVGSRL